ncbi:hypothetical protein F441_10791 [Phytophthora nicotianae CJ01A1]|uniref:DDE Tnp4 domain-containing protein n=1 Tax=Phytophthora nicotianae CJ01A1 TaxID=1317063 RepID=W2WVC4_PHYNI|nr:hypothetical protein F441_10791 [Phytophthora nicotianae CJ01A1]
MVAAQTRTAGTRRQQPITLEHALQSVATLRRINEDRLADRAAVILLPRADTDDEADSPSPVYDSYLNSREESIREMTYFGPLEFERLWSMIRDHMTVNCNTGCGRRSSFGGKDVFFMLLTVLKNCGKWDVVAAVFRVKTPSFQKMVTKFATVLSPFLYETLVASALERFPMKKLVLGGQAFTNYPYARYATAVTFQQSNMPAGRMQERALYYSKKHHLNGYKVEVSVLFNGQAVNCTQHFPGNTGDIDVFRRNAEFHLQALCKVDGDDEIPDDGRLVAQYPSSWAVLADKGYQGLARDFQAVTPYKRAPLQTLTLEQVATNERIAHDRIIVANYFGRLCTLWSICADKYRWDEDNYDVYFQVCVALTNFHIRANPLRREDGDSYARYLQRLTEIGDSIRSERREIQRRYRENRRNGLSEVPGPGGPGSSAPSGYSSDLRSAPPKISL